MRRRLDTYGYAPGHIEYNKEETIMMATHTLNARGVVPIYEANRKMLEWLNPMNEIVGKFVVMSILLPSKHVPLSLCEAVDGTAYSNLTAVDGQNVAVESDLSLATSQKLAECLESAINNEKLLKNVQNWNKYCGKQVCPGNQTGPHKKAHMSSDDSAASKGVSFNFSETYVNGNHATRITNNELHVVASSTRRMQPPAGATNVVFKSLSNSLACLLIPDDTWTNCDGAGSGKFRSERVYVVAIWDNRNGKPLDSDKSIADHSFQYKKRELAYAHANKDRLLKCAGGLHFFVTIEEANNYSYKMDAEELQQAQNYFEQLLADLPDNWNESFCVEVSGTHNSDVTTTSAPTEGSETDDSENTKAAASIPAEGSNIYDSENTKAAASIPAEESDTEDSENTKAAASIPADDYSTDEPAADGLTVSTYNIEDEPAEETRIMRFQGGTTEVAQYSDQETDFRNAQLRSFRVRLQYSNKLFLSHLEALRDMLDSRELELAYSIVECIDNIQSNSVEGIREAADAFEAADKFRYDTTIRYIDPKATRVNSSLYFTT